MKRATGPRVPMAFAVSVVLVASSIAFAAEPKIAVKPGEWGDASRENIAAVLQSAAREFCRHFPGDLDPIEVSRGKGSPQVLFRRGPNREYRVQLDVEGTFWAQFAFQFAHELCHIECRYRDMRHPNLWFEESLCETASLYTLRRMSEAWKARPPYPNWKSFASKLAAYAEKRMDDARLPENGSLAEWYRSHEIELREDAALRDLNTVVATAILPHFEKSPASWQAVSWLNTFPVDKEQSLAEFLQRWHDQCPTRHQAFVRSLAGELGVPLPERVKDE